MILSGKEVSKDLTEKLIREVKSLEITPTLAIVRVGANPSDMAYEKSAVKKAEKIGISVRNVLLDEDITQDELLTVIDDINRDESIHGVLMFRPLPKHIDEKAVCNRLDPQKDIDGITEGSMAGIYSGEDKGFSPCTAEAAIEILKYYDIPMAGKKAVVVGRSLVIGKPALMLLMAENATVTAVHSKTKEEDKIKACKDADIIIVATGRINTINDNHVTVNSTIIDVGINFDADGNMVGDANFDEIAEKVQAITPVPGGVGAVTTTLLMKHVVEASKKQMK